MLLQPMLARLAACHSLEETLHTGLRDLISLHGAEMGDVQLLGGEDALVIVAARGLSQAFLKTFERVDVNSASVCGRVLRTGRPLIVLDVDLDEGFAPYRALAAAVRFRSVMTFPLICKTGELIGAISAHSATTIGPTPLESETAERYCPQLADAIARWLPTAAQRALAAERLSQSVFETA